MSLRREKWRPPLPGKTCRKKLTVNLLTQLNVQPHDKLEEGRLLASACIYLHVSIRHNKHHNHVKEEMSIKRENALHLEVSYTCNKDIFPLQLADVQHVTLG